jgi:transposase
MGRKVEQANGTTLRQSGSHRNGRAHHLHDWRRRERAAAQWRLCSSLFDICGTVHREFVPQGQTVNIKFYCKVLQRLRENIQWKWLDLWHTKNWILHDDNAPCHRALLICEFLANHNMLSLPHPPYSSDLAPAYFFLFQKMKMQLKGRCFHTVVEIQHELQITTHTWSQKHQYNNFRC